MAPDWERLGAAVKARRNELALTQATVAARVGVKPMTIRNLENGRGYVKLPPTALLVARELGWTPESVQAVLDGGEPTLLPDAAPALAPEAGANPAPLNADELPLAVRIAIEFGQLLDYDVMVKDVGGKELRVVQLAYTNADTIDILKRQLDEFGEIKGYVRRNVGREEGEAPVENVQDSTDD